MLAGDTPLIDAARRGRAANVATLLADGAVFGDDVNESMTNGSGTTTRDCKTRERLQAELRFEQAVADGSLDGSSYSGGGGYGFGYGGAYSDEMAAHARRYSDDNDGAASGYGFEYDVGEADLGGAEFWG